MYTTRAIELFVQTKQVVEVPEGSQIVDITDYDDEKGPFLTVLYDQPDEGMVTMTKRVIRMTQIGAPIQNFQPGDWHYIGDFCARKDVRWIVWDCGSA